MIVLDHNSYISKDLNKLEAYYKLGGYREFPVTHVVFNDEVIYSNPKVGFMFIVITSALNRNSIQTVAEIIKQQLNNEEPSEISSKDILSTKDYYTFMSWDLGKHAGNMPAFDRFLLTKTELLGMLQRYRAPVKWRQEKNPTPINLDETKISTKQRKDNPNNGN